MRIPKSLWVLGVVAGLGAAAFVTRDRWTVLIASRTTAVKAVEETAAPIQEAKVLKLSPQARKNLGLVVKAAKPQTYWRTI